jgi:hypothetical protein
VSASRQEQEQEQERRVLETGLNASGLSYRELWWRQLCIGGDAGPLELEAYVLGLLRCSPHQHDLIAQALNEHYLDQGGDHPVTYSERGQD